MPSDLNARSLCAVAHVALLLLLRAHGAPVGNAPGATHDSSGEEQVSALVEAFEKAVYLIKVIDSDLAAVSKEHNSNLPLPKNCPISSLDKEACLQRMVEGLQVYMVLLKHVDSEYPNNAQLSQIKLYTMCLMNLIKDKMKNPQQVTALTSSQEMQLNIKNQDNFQRKMEANYILIKFRKFLIDAKTTAKKLQGSTANFESSPAPFYCPP